MPQNFITELLVANKAYARHAQLTTSPAPAKHVAILTCMDTRIEPTAALGLNVGDAHIIRNAGGRVTDDVIRSLLASSALLGVDTLLLMQHTQCGMELPEAEIQAKTGSSEEFFAIGDHKSALQDDAAKVLNHPQLGRIQTVATLMFDVKTGSINQIGDVVNREV